MPNSETEGQISGLEAESQLQHCFPDTEQGFISYSHIRLDRDFCRTLPSPHAHFPFVIVQLQACACRVAVCNCAAPYKAKCLGHLLLSEHMTKPLSCYIHRSRITVTRPPDDKLILMTAKQDSASARKRGLKLLCLTK